MNVRRVVILFLYCFGVVVVPAAIVVPLALFFMPAPYLVRAESLAIRDGAFVTPGAVFGADATIVDSARPGVSGTTAVAAATFPDGGSAAIAAFADPDAATAAADAALAKIPRASMIRTPGIVTFTREDGHRGLLATIGRYVFAIDGSAGSDPRARLESLPAVAANPEPDLASALLFDHWQWSIAALIAYVLIQLACLPRVASWAARIDPEPGTVAVDGATLRRRLLAINALEVPFAVAEGQRDGELVVEWRHTDARWAGPMAAAGVRIPACIRLHVGSDRARRVWVQDATGTGAVSLPWRVFKGFVLTHFERGRACGLAFRHGRLVVDDTYPYCFDIDEMKNPVIAIVTGSGWSYVPVHTKPFL